MKICGLYPLKASGIDILQMNITRRSLNVFHQLDGWKSVREYVAPEKLGLISKGDA